MKDTDIEGIESFLDEVKEDIEKGSIDKARDRMSWLLSQAIASGDRDLFVIEGILRLSIGSSFRGIIEFLGNMGGKMEKEEAKDLSGRARDTLADMVILSKGYLHNRDKIKFFDSIAHDYHALREIKEKLRLEVKG